MRKEDEEFRSLKKLENIAGTIDRDVDAAIVEGSRDRKAIKQLGFDGRVFISAERAVEDLAEDVIRGSDTVAVLTDFDTHGREQNKLISQSLQEDINVDFTARKKFGKELTSQGRYAIEDVLPLFSSWRDKFTEATLDRLFPI